MNLAFNKRTGTYYLFIFLILCFIIIILQISSVQGNHRDTVLQKLPRETNLINFVRLFVLRLIYGFATMFGFGESISEVGDGALVPPGVDDDYIDDYRDYSYWPPSLVSVIAAFGNLYTQIQLQLYQIYQS